MIPASLNSALRDFVTKDGPSFVAALGVLLILLGCAAEVTRSPVAFRPAESSTNRVIELTQLTTLVLATGYQRSLLTGSRWEFAGSLAAGDVYRPVGTVFTIEGANMHEAFLVISDSMVVGFYLPGEQAYSALEPWAPIRFKPLN